MQNVSLHLGCKRTLALCHEKEHLARLLGKEIMQRMKCTFVVWKGEHQHTFELDEATAKEVEDFLFQDCLV